MSQRFFPFFFLLWATLLTVPAQAQLCSAQCEVSLRPGNQTVELKLEGWLFLDASAVDVTVLDEPLFGAWVDEKYSPGEDFWQTGGDRIRFSVEEIATGMTTIHTVVLKVADIVNDHSGTENFESTQGLWANLDPVWDILGTDAEITPSDEGLADDYSMDISFSTVTPMTSRIGRDSEEPKNGIDQMSGTVIVNATPPPNTTFSDAFGYSILSLSSFVRVELRYENETYSVRTVIDSLTCTDCATDWQDLVPEQSYEISLSLGREALGHPFAVSAFGLDVSIEEVAGSWRAEYEIEDLGPMNFVLGDPDYSIGAFDPWGQGEARLRMDEATFGYGSLEISPLIAVVEDFADGLESSAWTTNGHIGTYLVPGSISSVGPDADWRGAVQFVDLGPNSSDSSWVDDGPTRSTTLWAHLKYDRSQLGLGPWTSFNVLEGKDAAGYDFMKLRVRTDSRLAMQFMLRVRDGSGVVKSTSWISMGDGETDVDVVWDGQESFMELRVGDISQRVDLVPGPFVIDEVSFGLTNLGAGVSPPTPNSRYLVDDFALLYQ